MQHFSALIYSADKWQLELQLNNILQSMRKMRKTVIKSSLTKYSFSLAVVTSDWLLCGMSRPKALY